MKDSRLIAKLRSSTNITPIKLNNDRSEPKLERDKSIDYSYDEFYNSKIPPKKDVLDDSVIIKKISFHEDK